MDLRALRVFVEVVKLGGFTAASRSVHLTQPSISRVIKQLEDDLGHRLLTRDHREVTLTDAGNILYTHALTLLGESARLRTALSDMADLEKGELRLGIPPLGGTMFVPLIKRFKSRYPGIELHLHELASKPTELALTNAELDLGTLLLPVDPSRFNSVPLSRDRLMLVTQLESSWSQRKQVKLDELREESFILFPDGYGLNDLIHTACQAAGFTPLVAGRSSHTQLITGLVDSGMGVALLPMSVVHDATNVAVIELTSPSIAWHIGLAWLQGTYLSHAAKAMLQMVKQHPLPSARPRRG
ncbi:LysR family transcriptional regulator [Phragmitibacter flavus]|nr:LysR family transcriptional regulator [Phragmitibacter flavus]